MNDTTKAAMLVFFMQGFEDGVRHRPVNSMKEYRQRIKDIAIRENFRGTPKVAIKDATKEYEKGLAVGMAAWQAAVDGARKRLNYPSVSYVTD